MSWLDGLKHRIGTLLRPATHERGLADEIQLHMDLDAANERDTAGAPHRFGNRTYYMEEARGQTWLGFIDVVRQDLGYAWRTTRRSPGFTVVVVLMLALGIGVNAATFSVLDRFYLRPPGGVEAPWDAAEIDMAVPFSPPELEQKTQAIFHHKSQRSQTPVATGLREPWQQAEQHNRGLADTYDKLGLANYEAIEGFQRWQSS